MKISSNLSILLVSILVIGVFFINLNKVRAFALPPPVSLLTTLDFTILSKTGITNTGSHTSVITGNIGSSPITAAAMNNVYCSEITGTIFGVDAAYTGSGSSSCFAGNPPLANKTEIDQAVADMGTAYTQAAGLATTTADNQFAGNLGGQTLSPGVYKWDTDVTIPTSVTLSGLSTDYWVFKIAGNLSIASGGSVPAGVKVILAGGALAKNVFWQVGGLTGATLGTYSTFNGNILSAKQVIMQTGAVLNGRALAQTQVTLDADTVTDPGDAGNNELDVITAIVGGTANFSDFTDHVKQSGVDISGSPLAGAADPGNFYNTGIGNYVVSQAAPANYTQSFSGACDSSGNVTMYSGDWKICTVTNTYVQPVVALLAGNTSNAGTFAVQPSIGVKIASSPAVLPSGPGVVKYTYTATNTGTVPMIGVWVKDSKCLDTNLISGDTNANNILDIGEAWVYSCTKNVSTTETSVATAHGQASGWDVYDTASTTVVVGQSQAQTVATSSVETQSHTSSQSEVVCPFGHLYSETTGQRCTKNIGGDVVPAAQNNGPTKAQATSMFQRSLSLTMRGADVAMLQAILASKGLLVMPQGTVPGYFGLLTRSSIQKYQSAIGLSPVGVFGPQTRAKIISELAE